MKTENKKAGFIIWSSNYRKDRYKEAWEVTMFRNENSGFLSSDLIKYGIWAAIEQWGSAPQDGIITYVNDTKIDSVHPGYCFKWGGFKKVGKSQKGLTILQSQKRWIELCIKELDLRNRLAEYQKWLDIALQEGEWCEAPSLQQEAMQVQRSILNVQLEMKEDHLKAWGQYQRAMKRWELESVISTYEGLSDFYDDDYEEEPLCEEADQ
jgi:hypothetical protein